MDRRQLWRMRTDASSSQSWMIDCRRQASPPAGTASSQLPQTISQRYVTPEARSPALAGSPSMPPTARPYSAFAGEEHEFCAGDARREVTHGVRHTDRVNTCRHWVGEGLRGAHTLAYSELGFAQSRKT